MTIRKVTIQGYRTEYTHTEGSSARDAVLVSGFRHLTTK